MLLTGDNASAANNIAKIVGIETVHTDLLPEDKMKIIKDYSDKGEAVCMIGDGVNDALALTSADAGIAMGGIGSDIAIESADAVLVSDEIKRLSYLFDMMQRVMKKIKVNIIASLVINLSAVILSAFGVLTPITGALWHNFGSVFVVFNEQTCKLVIVIIDSHFHGLFLSNCFFSWKYCSALKGLDVVPAVPFITEPMVVDVGLTVSIFHMTSSFHQSDTAGADTLRSFCDIFSCICTVVLLFYDDISGDIAGMCVRTETADFYAVLWAAVSACDNYALSVHEVKQLFETLYEKFGRIFSSTTALAAEL